MANFKDIQNVELKNSGDILAASDINNITSSVTNIVDILSGKKTFAYNHQWSLYSATLNNDKRIYVWGGDLGRCLGKCTKFELQKWTDTKDNKTYYPCGGFYKDGWDSRHNYGRANEDNVEGTIWITQGGGHNSNARQIPTSWVTIENLVSRPNGTTFEIVLNEAATAAGITGWTSLLNGKKYVNGNYINYNYIGENFPTAWEPKILADGSEDPDAVVKIADTTNWSGSSFTQFNKDFDFHVSLFYGIEYTINLLN